MPNPFDLSNNEQDKQEPAIQAPNNPFEDTYSAPPVPASYADMPNAERLTPVEHWLYNKLPGFSQSTVGKALASFSESWAGKALSYLDIGAEALERTLGLARQLPYIQASGEKLNLAAAWYAGSLFADMTNLPTLKRDENGKVIGIMIPSDLPGIDGLTAARQSIATLIQAGVDPGEALIEVRDRYYNDMGALALRAQLYDTYFHIFADPVNYLMPEVKPVERIQALRTLALAGKVPIDELVDLEKAARAAGNIAEAERIASTIAKVETGELKGMTTVDKLAIFLTGGNPLEPGTLGKGFVGKINPLALRPEARAQEIVTMLTDHVGSYILSRFWDDPQGAVQAIEKATRGALGPEFGHAFLSIEGRTAQGFMGGVSASAQDLLGHYQRVLGERNFLSLASTVLDEDAGRLVMRMADEPEVVLRQLMNKATPELATLLQNGQLTAEEIGKVGKLLKTLPYDANSFMTELMIRVEDFGMQQAILQFGVGARGLVSRWSGAIKSAETLAFLRLNPAYGVRNVLNNEFTMLARGVWNAMSPSQIAEFWAEQGWRPRRLAQGFGMAGEGFRVESKAAKALEEALRGGNFGAPEKAKMFFNNVKLGKADISELSRIAEENASTRAFTAGYIQGLREYFWKPGNFERIADVLEPSTIDALRKIDPDLPEIIEQVVQSSGAIEHKLDEALQINARVNFPAIAQEVEKKLGYKLDDVLGPEMVQHIASGLPKAIKDGKVSEFFLGVRNKLEKHLDDIVEKNIQELPGIVEQQVKAGGPQMFYRKFGDIIDDYWAGEVEHAIRMPTVTEAARSAQAEGNLERATALWDQLLHDEDKFFTGRDKRIQAIMKGLQKGAKDAGISMPTEVRSNFKEVTKGWRKFFKARNDGYKTLRGLSGNDFTDALGKLRNELDTAYRGMIDEEARLTFEIDEAVAQMIDDPALQNAFRNWRNSAAEMRRLDKEATAELMQRVRDLPADLRQKAMEEFWADRHERMLAALQVDRTGMQMLSGDQQALRLFSKVKATGYTPEVRKLVGTYKIKGGPEHVKNLVNKFLRGEYTGETVEGAKQIANVSEIDADLLRKALRARLAAGSGEIPEGMTMGDFMRVLEETPEDVAKLAGEQRTFINDISKVIPDPMPVDLGLSGLMYSRVSSFLSSLEDSVRAGVKKTPVFLDQLPKEAQGELMKYLTQVKGQMGDARFAATRFAEFRRDAALLNYQRRINFDAWAGNVFPYIFWTTGSIVKWAVNSIDRPAMLSTFLRMRKLLATAGEPKQGFPTRLKGSIRVKLPFAPPWMGDQFVDPLRAVLPMDTFMMPYERYQQNRYTLEGRTERLLSDMLHEGTITQVEYDEAMTHEGPTWDRALAQAELDNEDLKFDAWDFATLMSSPHAPIMWAYNAARGTPEEIGPFTPMSRTLRNVGTMLGIKDWNNSPLNLEAKVRKALGLPAYDRWDDYRVQRMISNMTAEGVMTVDSAKRIMTLVDDLASGKISRDEAMQDPLWDQYQEATRRANQEYASGWGGTLLGTLGIPVKSYPVGEKEQRALQVQFSQAYQAYDNGNVQALTDFFDKHPEYETRLALFKEPEERLSTFLVDQMWGLYHELPSLNRKELREQLGDDFETFLSGDGKNLPPEKLQVWLKLAGANPIGTLSADTKLLSELFDKVRYTEPEIAWRTQSFYNIRTARYPNWYEEQNTYYSKPQGKERSSYLKETPDLQGYWDWRRDYMYQNPDIVPYLTDDEDTLAKFANRKRNPVVAVPTAAEFAAQLSRPMQELLAETAQGEPLSDVARRRLEQMGEPYGLTSDNVLNIIVAGTSP